MKQHVRACALAQRSLLGCSACWRPGSMTACNVRIWAALCEASGSMTSLTVARPFRLRTVHLAVASLPAPAAVVSAAADQQPQRALINLVGQRLQVAIGLDRIFGAVNFSSVFAACFGVNDIPLGF